jgi:iron complex outermembrane receptor protein
MVATAALTILSPSAYADRLDREIKFDIPAQPMPSALVLFAKQANVQLITASIDLGKLLSPGVTGKLAARHALEKVLGRTGLTYSLVGENTVTIRLGSTTSDDTQRPSSPDAASSARLAQSSTTIGQPPISLDGPQSNNSAASGSSNSERAGIAEIVVTAQKRDQRLQDVPVPVTVVNAQALVDSNQLRVQDYYTQVPGLSASLNNSGAANLAIRGITTGDGANPTVGVVVDDVPYGSSTVLGSGAAIPDIDPSELARVEVLRGPQGTLYGASSIGGLLKFVTVDPSTDGLSGQVQVGANGVQNGNEAGYSVRGAINVPVSDTLAFRASVFTRRDPGYVDNIQTGEKGINRGDADGGRLSALWRPSEVFSAKVSALFQDNRTYGSPNVMVGPGLGDLQQEALRGTGGYDNKIQAYSATLTGNLVGFQLTSVTGYSVNKTFLRQDLSPALGEAAVTLFEADTSKFSQELRLSKQLGSKLDWLLGVFYTHESSSVVSPILAADSTTGAPTDVLDSSYAPSKFTEYAAFTDLTFHLTDRFDLQVGGRESRNDQSYYQIQAGPLVPLLYPFPSPFVQGPIKTDDTAFTYLATPSFKLSSDLMVYARLASGYRPGGPNVGGVVFDAPISFAPDKTQNYELGLKGSVLDHTLSFDGSLYRIDWKNIQLVAIVGNASFETNGSRARSQGVELSLESKPLTGFTIGAWAAWNQATLTEPFPPSSAVSGSVGDRLPYAARFSGRLSLQQDFPLARDLTGFVATAVSYVGNREGEFGPSLALRQTYPAYAQTDLRGGVKYNSWSVNVYATNIADKRGLLNGGLNFFPPNAFNYIQPRTVGLTVTKRFAP